MWKNLTDRPGGDPPSPSRRADAVADMPESPHLVVGPRAQRDAAQHRLTIDDPPRARGRQRPQPAHPGGEPVSTADLIVGPDAEAVLVQARPPFPVRRKPGRATGDVREDQLEHGPNVPA